MKNNILICGAGQGGHAIAAYSALMGNEVTLYTHTPKKAEIINEKGNKLTLSGLYNAEVQLNDVTTDLEAAVKNNENIFIVTDATAHQYYAENMAPYLTNQNIILVSPGVGGALDFTQRVKKINLDSDISVSETDTLVYACKVPEIGHSYIKTEKNSILYSTVPEDRDIGGLIHNLYPQFQNANNTLMGLDDSPVFHIVGMLKNSDRILNQEDFNFYIDGATKEATELMEKMDNERREVASKLGIEPRSVKEWLNIAYGVPESDLYTMIQNTPPYQNTSEIPNRSPAPKTLFHRYLLEEIPLRAVPTVEIGKIFGLKLPIYRQMINESCRLTGIDFWKTGRTIEDMGLTEKDILEWKTRYS